MIGVGQIFEYVGCFSSAVLSVDGINGRESGLYDELGYIDNSPQFIAVLDRAVPKPGCDATRMVRLYMFGSITGDMLNLGIGAASMHRLHQLLAQITNTKWD